MTSPDKQGLNAALLCAMDEGISGGKLANVDDIVVIRHGVLVYERYFDYPHQLNYDATTRHNGYSMTKSVVSLLVGIAMDRGLIRDLDAPLASYLPDDKRASRIRKGSYHAAPSPDDVGGIGLRPRAPASRSHTTTGKRS